MSRTKKKRVGDKGKHEPLVKQILERDSGLVKGRSQPRVKSNRTKKIQEKKLIDQDLSEKILREAIKLNEEEEREELQNSQKEKKKEKKENEKISFNPNFDDQQNLSDESSNEEDYEEFETEEITMEEEELFKKFMSNNEKGVSITDRILQAIEENERELALKLKSSEKVIKVQKKLNPKATKVYKKVGNFLQTYKSGKLPKALQFVPLIKDYEKILIVSRPETWSNQAVSAVTKLFACSGTPKVCEFYNKIVLLPHIRNDLEENKKLNYHLYEALKRACFKPSAFYKGIVIPLCQKLDCTLREANVVSSIIKRRKLPALHSSAALLRISLLEYTGAISIFVRAIITKNYSLPLRVIGGIVNHLSSFYDFKEDLPLCWHLCFLDFVQRYSTQLNKEQIQKLLKLIIRQSHYAITPVIRGILRDTTPKEEQLKKNQQKIISQVETMLLD
ncbi:bystin [Anaeramoeba flamelloides]|uniref:Bystin n=1 Tax=Anaeramoeba flamelloides TaxID=1746091 RepID=A0AAV7YPL4_9EUKA|nr:bystin [Anaeramoeba flamelloides]KAJ6238761.1 bystin [Anaeramoeba flamelloides]